PGSGSLTKRSPSSANCPPATAAVPPASHGKPCHSPEGGTTVKSARAGIASITSPPSASVATVLTCEPCANCATESSTAHGVGGVVKLADPGGGGETALLARTSMEVTR